MEAAYASEELLDQLSQKTGQSRDEIQEKILEKTRKFSGLLNEEAALVLLAKEAGITQIPKRIFSPTPLNQLQSNQSTADVVGRVKRVFAPKPFTNKQGGTGKKASVLIADSTAEQFVAFWNNDADLLDKIKTNDVLAIQNAVVREFNGQCQLSFGYASSLELNPAKITAELPSFETKIMKLSEIKEMAYNISVEAKIEEVLPIKEFSRQTGENGKLQRITLYDDGTELTAIAWNQKTEETNTLKPGQTVRFDNCRTKPGMQGGFEIHLDQNSRITVTAEKKEE